MTDDRAPDASGPPSESDEAPSGYELLGTSSSPFAHPRWALGMVLVLAVPFLILGLFGHPVWLLIGSPFVAVFVIWLITRVMQWRRTEPSAVDAGESGDV